jgi:signal transduction histidine kinase
MRERVEQLGGCFNVVCNGEGTTVMAMIPMEMDFNG